MNSDSDTEEEAGDLPVSDLGKKEHWDEVYETELKNYVENGVRPDGWFGSLVTRRIMSYLKNNTHKTDSIIDIGCGNGDLIRQLVEGGWSEVEGIDYSSNAIDLCQKIFQLEYPEKNISFRAMNIMSLKEGSEGKYEVCLDKGTYDAICLDPAVTNQEDVRDTYWTNIWTLLQPTGFIVIVSCNWTLDEIRAQASKWFDVKTTIPTQAYNFRGSTGASTSISVLIKKLEEKELSVG